MSKNLNNEEDLWYYCRRCLSPKIVQVPMLPDINYCVDCGTTDIVSSSFEEWDEMYVEKYGHHYIDK